MPVQWPIAHQSCPMHAALPDVHETLLSLEHKSPIECLPTHAKKGVEIESVQLLLNVHKLLDCPEELLMT